MLQLLALPFQNSLARTVVLVNSQLLLVAASAESTVSLSLCAMSQQWCKVRCL